MHWSRWNEYVDVIRWFGAFLGAGCSATMRLSCLDVVVPGQRCLLRTRHALPQKLQTRLKLAGVNAAVRTERACQTLSADVTTILKL